MARKTKGLSKATIKHSSKFGTRTSTILTAGKQSKRREENAEARYQAIQKLSWEDRAAIDAMDSSLSAVHGIVSAPTVVDAIPPGQEGHDFSHEGGEYEAFVDLVDGVRGFDYQNSRDDRDRSNRTQLQNIDWDRQINALVDAYLKYRSNDMGDGMPSMSELGAPDPGRSFHIDGVDIFSRRQLLVEPWKTEAFANETLIRYGFIGSSPLFPTVAISLRTLHAYRQTHRTCPRFSIEAQCKTLCHMHNVPFRKYLTAQFSTTFDIYLAILRRIDDRLRSALRQDTPNWRLLNTCPACFYKLKDEPELRFSFLCSIDGNNSLKRLANTVHGNSPYEDSRSITSDRWLTPSEVDQFAKEITVNATANNVLDDWEDEDDDKPSKCTDRWRNAGPEVNKRMFSIFDESGIFIAACRHRFVLLICDMVRSGELAKYPLAIANRLMAVYGANIGCAYDIGCSFTTTLRNSVLGGLASKLNFRVMVGAFHGHAHNRLCQLRYHPLYIPGTGNTEGEGCEHVFSSSNDQARNTRHATRFHRHQALDEHFTFWDHDKYTMLGRFLLNHYRQALGTVATLEADLESLKAQLNLTDANFEYYFSCEETYLNGLKQCPLLVTLKVKYVRALRELSQLQSEFESACAAITQIYTSIATPQYAANALRARNTVDAAAAKLQVTEALVRNLETNLGIEKRWTVGSPEYIQYMESAQIQDYQSALDELERLVVQRLFELSKLSMSGTGYKLRQQIGKALQRRSEAIRNALTRYNTEAKKLNPPRPALSWKEIVEYSFIAEFDLLRNSRLDIRDEEWTHPARREATTKYFRLCRAREELVRLNTEICRVRTAIHDEVVHTNQIISELKNIDAHLCCELERRWVLRSATNQSLLTRLNQIEALHGFTGTPGYIGVRHGTDALAASMSTVSEDGLAELDMVDDEDELHEIDKLTDFMESIEM